MEKTLTTLIQDFRTGDNQSFMLIAEKFKPLISRYIRSLYKDEQEDTESELILSLLEAVRKIDYYEQEGQAVVFLGNAIRFKFHELYRISRKIYDHQDYLTEIQENTISFIPKEFDAFIWKEDCLKFLSTYNKKQGKMLYLLLFEGKSDIEVAKIFNVSRQYVHSIKKKLCSELKCKYYEGDGNYI
ncbi:hypothetical protein LJC58_08440 [Lachnospiraceae bacterium OttesenSCG-928-D06]|nr:hypothetical protein [Lachnospiraceae bacterium OttesenSCG-928-D06]